MAPKLLIPPLSMHFTGKAKTIEIVSWMTGYLTLMYGRAVYIKPTSLEIPLGYNKKKVLYLHNVTSFS